MKACMSIDPRFAGGTLGSELPPKGAEGNSAETSGNQPRFKRATKPRRNITPAGPGGPRPGQGSV